MFDVSIDRSDVRLQTRAPPRFDHIYLHDDAVAWRPPQRRLKTTTSELLVVYHIHDRRKAEGTFNKWVHTCRGTRRAKSGLAESCRVVLRLRKLMAVWTKGRPCQRAEENEPH